MRESKRGGAERSRWREEDAGKAVEGWRQSGLSARAYGQREGVHPRRLLRWAARLQERKAEALHFHPVQVVQRKPREPQPDAWLEIVVADGSRIRVPHGFRAEDLMQVLDVLEGRAAC